MKLSPKQQQFVTECAADFKPLVMKIESGIATTQNHYGKYGAVISQLSKGNKNAAGFIALALVEAGANRLGVAYGLKLFV